MVLAYCLFRALGALLRSSQLEKPIPDFGRDGLLMFFAQLIASQQPPLVWAATTSC
jgi:hypothetical protein